MYVVTSVKNNNYTAFLSRRYFLRILTRHAEIIWISDEQRVTNAFVGLVITTRSNTAEMFLTLFFASPSNTNVRCDARSCTRTSIWLTRSAGKRVTDESFWTLTSRPLWRYYTLCFVTTNVPFARCDKIFKTKREFFFKIHNQPWRILTRHAIAKYGLYITHAASTPRSVLIRFTVRIFPTRQKTAGVRASSFITLQLRDTLIVWGTFKLRCFFS